MFSIPINPKLSSDQFNEFYQFCSDHQHLIYDLYFTCRMPPFTQDAMGDIITIHEDISSAIESALHIQRTLGIEVSATFNNIKVPPTQKNLDLFIYNFKQLYDAGIKSATIPHTHWVATKQLQKAFPELKIKNTILRNVRTANDVAKLAEAGFHYVNIDRDLMRDHETLKRIKKAATRYDVKIALLANEGCLGGCIMMDEHFEFNNSRQSGPAYFHDPISRVSCPKWDIEDSSVPLKTANIPPWKEDWLELLELVDVFKMHGRESVNQLYRSMDIVRRYAANQEILFDGFEEYITDNNLKERPIDAWRKIIKNCKFECWDCKFCDNIYNNKSKNKSSEFLLHVVNEIVDSVNYKNNISVPGLTSSRVQNLLYGITSHAASYLEIGSAMGSTAVAVGSNNIKMYCIDNWSSDIQPETSNFILPINTRGQFEKNTQHINNLTIIDEDFLNVDISDINNIDVMFYDGPHDFDSTFNAVKYYQNCLSNTAVLIFDDANWQGVVQGADRGIAESNLNVVYSKLILNDIEDSNMWWNGLYIVVVEK